MKSLINAVFFIGAATCLWLSGSGSLAAETRAAIVIGNSDYVGAELSNPRNDAALMAQTLRELGFEVSLYLDVTTAQTPLLTDKITEKLSKADVGVFYFAGHGLQYNGENLLLPVDTDLTSVAGISKSGTPLSLLLRSVMQGGTGIKIIILDACRNPLVKSGDKELKSGFSFVEAPAGEVLIAFSTGAGEVAFDSSGGQNSPYTAALANALQETGSDIYDVFRSVRRAVRAGTGGQQIPWITGSIESDYVFRPGVRSVEVAPLASTDPGQIKTASGEVLSIDRVLWEYLQSSADPDDFARFSEVFPESPYAEKAKEREQIQVAEADTARETLTRDGVSLSTDAIAKEVDSTLADTPERAARTSVLLDQSGSYVMRDSFRTWPLQLPVTEAGLGSSATACDEEAADPVDPDKLSPGVSESSIDIRRALRACAFNLAKDPENPRLLFQFARVLDIARRHDWANAYYDRAVDLSYSAAMVNRGFNARMGRGQEVDQSLAVTLYRRAASVGNPRARTNLGSAYLKGEGVDKNEEEGVLWLRLAASMGWPHAVNALGDAYRTGSGVEMDSVEAVSLYRSAAEQGQTTAMANLGQAYLEGNGVDKDVPVGLSWLDRSLGLGNGFAPVFSGRFYLKGDGAISADPAKAKTLFEAAIRRGNPAGYMELTKAYDQGQFPEGENLNEAYRNALFAQAGKIKKADELVEKISKKLALADQAAIKAEVDTFLKLNGL